MAKSKITSEMLGGAIKTTSAPSRRSRTDIAFIAVRILLVADIILTFVPSVNPARISSMINRNLSLFTCGIFLSEMSTIKQLINIKEAAAAFAATASLLVEVTGLEPTASSSRTKRSTKLSHTSAI